MISIIRFIFLATPWHVLTQKSFNYTTEVSKNAKNSITRLEATLRSDSYPLILRTRHSKHAREKRAAEALTSENCLDMETLYLSHGTFRAYTLESLGEENDESERKSYKCMIDSTIPPNCEQLLKPTVQNASLVINEVLQEGENHQTTQYIAESAMKYFHLILHYESHKNATLYCAENLTSRIKLVSNELQIPRVDELFEVTLIPESTNVKVGSSYNLTCTFSNARALKFLRWTRQASIQSSAEELKCQEGAEISCSVSETPPRSILTVQTNETERFKGETYVYYCTTKYTGHSNQPRAEARVTLQVGKIFLIDSNIRFSILCMVYLSTVIPHNNADAGRNIFVTKIALQEAYF